MTQALSQLIAPAGVTYATMLEFMREQDTHVSIDLLNNFNTWVESLQGAGQYVDEDLVTTVRHDLTVHHRLTPETLIGASHAPYISLDHTEDQHFGRD